MDKDGSGTISLEEFTTVLSAQANLSEGNPRPVALTLTPTLVLFGSLTVILILAPAPYLSWSYSRARQHSLPTKYQVVTCDGWPWPERKFKSMAQRKRLGQDQTCLNHVNVVATVSSSLVFYLYLQSMFACVEILCLCVCFFVLSAVRALVHCPTLAVEIQSYLRVVDVVVVVVVVAVVVGDGVPVADIKSLFDSMDVDKGKELNGKELNFNEFLAATLERRQLDEMRLKLAFDRLDFDHSGTIDGEITYCRPPFCVWGESAVIDSSVYCFLCAGIEF